MIDTSIKASRERFVWKWRVNPPQIGSNRADRILYEAFQNHWGTWEGRIRPRGTEFSRSQIQKWIHEQRVKCDRTFLKPNSKIRPGSEISIEIPEPESIDLVAQDIPLQILHEDSDIAVINKPSGLTVHPSSTQKKDTLVNAILHQIQDLSGIGGKLRPGIVHRLDKFTSGSLVITKNDEAHQKMSKIFSEHRIDRRYWALCFGAIGNSKELKLESRIGRNPRDRKKMMVLDSGGRHAETDITEKESFRVGTKAPFASLIEAQLHTGRTHQVRVHLTHIGHSILGDPLYGKAARRHTKFQALPAEIQLRVLSLSGQALHAHYLRFEHPVSGKVLEIDAPPPKEFSLLLEALHGYRN